MPRSLSLFFFFLAFVLIGFPVQAQPDQYALGIAQKGEGVLMMLERYGIRYPCNVPVFYSLNNMKEGEGLRRGRAYLLPIYVYKYNGRSIRSTTGNNDLPWAKKVQAYNESMLGLGLRIEDYRQDSLLWVPYHYFFCPEEEKGQSPSASTTEVAETMTRGTSPVKTSAGPLRGIYDIFGPKYAQVPHVSNELLGCVYYLVAGHGGPDPGATTTKNGHTLCEDEYAYDVAMRISWLLTSRGATVYCIVRDPDDGIRDASYLKCDKDERVWGNKHIPRSQSSRLTQRSDIINEIYEENADRGVAYQRVVTIHVDSDKRNERVDLYFYHQQMRDESRQLALSILRYVRDRYAEVRKGRGYDGQVSSRDLHMLREVKPVSVFIELGNIHNSNDQARLIKTSNRRLVSEWIFGGLIEDALKSIR